MLRSATSHAIGPIKKFGGQHAFPGISTSIASAHVSESCGVPRSRGAKGCHAKGSDSFGLGLLDLDAISICR